MKVKKITALFIVILIIVFQFNSNIIFADTNDIVGLATGEIYYIRNYNSGGYLTVAGGDGNLQNVVTSPFTGAKNQQWKLIRNSNGLYTLESVFSTRNPKRVLDVTGFNVDIYDPTYPTDQRFKLKRLGNGQYSIMWTPPSGYDYFFGEINSLGQNIKNVTASESSTVKNSLWAFDLVKKMAADIYSFRYQIGTSFFFFPIYYDTTGTDTIYKNNVDSMGYRGYSFTNLSHNHAFNWMQTTSIWVHHGHGNAGIMGFSDSNGDFTGYIFRQEINALPKNQLAKLKVFITMGCKTGQSSNGNNASAENNLIYAVYEKGAHFAMGWKNDVEVSKGVAWLKTFLTESNRGVTIKDAMERASYESYVGVAVFIGDRQQKLKN